MLLGGRTAEELIFADPTTGAQNDIERATKIARAMVTEYGMSDALGPMQFGQHHGEVFLGRDFASQPDYSDEVAAKIDGEVRRLIDGAHEIALDILTTHRTVLDEMAQGLIEKETLETDEVMAIFAPVPKWRHPGTNGGGRHRPRPAAPLAAGPRRPWRPRGSPRRRERGPPGPLAGIPAAGGPSGGVAAAPHRPPPRRAGRAGDPARHRRGSRPDGLVRTPARVADMFGEIFAGLEEDPAAHLTVRFDADHDEMVMVRDIPLYSSVRAPPRAVHRQGPRGLHPGRRRPHHRAVEAGPPGRRVPPAGPRSRSASPRRSPTPSSGCCSPGACSWSSRPSTCACRCGGAQAGVADGHLRRAGPVQDQRRHPGRGDGVHPPVECD